jgi:hypothetical protein
MPALQSPAGVNGSFGLANVSGSRYFSSLIGAGELEQEGGHRPPLQEEGGQPRMRFAAPKRIRGKRQGAGLRWGQRTLQQGSLETGR